jgi:hypothetical protein
MDLKIVVFIFTKNRTLIRSDYWDGKSIYIFDFDYSFKV